MEEKQSRITKVIKSLFPYLILTFSLFSGFIGKNNVMVTAFLAFVIVLFLNNFDKISEIRVSGLLIKAREIVEQAQIKIEQLQDISKKFVEIQLTLITQSWRYTIKGQEEAKNNLIQGLSNLGVSKVEQEEILNKVWNPSVMANYVYDLGGGSQIPRGITNEEYKEWEKIFRAENLPSPETIQKFLVEKNYLTPDLKEILEDYRFFIENHKHRRLEEWNKYRSEVSEPLCKQQTPASE